MKFGRSTVHLSSRVGAKKPGVGKHRAKGGLHEETLTNGPDYLLRSCMRTRPRSDG